MRKLAIIGGLVLIVLLAAVMALADGEIVIEEHGQSSGGVGGQFEVNKGGLGINLKVRPGSDYSHKTTIRTRGDIQYYRQYPGCVPPCNIGYCYPLNHPCAGCNAYSPTPCPAYKVK
jgi:hypothetical protein